MKQLGYIKKKIREADLFGFKVNLNFDRKTEIHKSFVGGIISIIVLAFFMWYFVILIYKMIYHE